MRTLFPIVGQKKTLNLLHRMSVNERYANAYLFYGPEGTGKEAFAMEFAALMNCQSPGDQPCGECHGCKQMRQLQHPNLHLLFALPGGQGNKSDDPLKGLSESVLDEVQQSIINKSRNPYEKIRISGAKFIKISSVRDMQKNVHLGLPEKGRKVVLIFGAEQMNNSSYNSILKIVEEPPDHTSFIFCTSNLQGIPETIRSRCQLMPFRHLTTDDIIEGLDQYGLSDNPQATAAVARMANGDFGFALELSRGQLNHWEEAVIEFMRAVMRGQVELLQEQVDRLEARYAQSPDALKRFLILVQLWFHDARLYAETGETDRLVYPQMLDKIESFIGHYSHIDYVSAQILLENSFDFIERNVYIRLALYSLQVQLRRAIQGELESKYYGYRHRFQTNSLRGV